MRGAPFVIGALTAVAPALPQLTAHCGEACVVGRRGLLATIPFLPLSARAASGVMDPRFSLTLPAGFVVSKRKAETGTIFVAGNFPRAASISVTAWPVEEVHKTQVHSMQAPHFTPPVQLMQ